MSIVNSIKNVLRPFKNSLLFKYSLLPKIKVYSDNRFTVLCTVYNVEKYLEEFFESITSQTLDFEKHIFLLVIDDGSQDSSAQIIKNWQNKYPKNITYIYKENGGQQSAFNLGLQHVKTPWVTFIDPDDTVNPRYFQEVNKCIKLGVDIVSTNIIFYFEDTKIYKPHYLHYRFKYKIKIVNPISMQGYIQSTIATVFIRTNLIQKENLQFNSKIKPVMYDGCFINNLLLAYPKSNIAFIKNAHYYYRKREDNSSLVNAAWQNPGRYIDVIKYGLIDLLEMSQKGHKKSPLYIQRYVLYQIQYYYKRIVNGGDTLSFMSDSEINDFKKLLIILFSYIDAEVIESCNLGGLWHKYRIGFYNLYKDKIIFKQVCYVDSFDKGELSLHYYYHSESNDKYTLNGEILTPISENILEHKFLDEIFLYEKRITIPCTGKWKYFNAQIGDIETQISYKAKRYTQGIKLNKIISS